MASKITRFVGFLVFSDFGGTTLDHRVAGAALPAGSIVIYCESYDTGLFFDQSKITEEALHAKILEARFDAACAGAASLTEKDFAEIAQSGWAGEAVNKAIGLRRKEWVKGLAAAGLDFDAGKAISEIEDAEFEHQYDRGMREYLHHGSGARQIEK